MSRRSSRRSPSQWTPSMRAKIEAALKRDGKRFADEFAIEKRRSRAGRKAWRGTIKFDSETEAAVYDSLSATNPLVIAHGKIALGDTNHIEPDFVVVERVMADGSFVGRLVDAKAAWVRNTKRHTHIERDWRVKRNWLRDKCGLEIEVVTRVVNGPLLGSIKNTDRSKENG